LTWGPESEERGCRGGQFAPPALHVGDIMRKPIRCILGRHHNVWKSNPDGEAYQQCSRCGRDAGLLSVDAMTEALNRSNRGDVSGGGVS
jgi:hypothetical protein